MDISRKHIESLGGFSGKLPDTIKLMLNVVPKKVPEKLALSIVLSELTVFITSFRNNIQLNTDSKKHKTFVPTNAYNFCLSPSGVSKDRTRNLIRSLMKGGYNVLEDYLDSEVDRKAKAVAIAETGKDASYPAYKIPWTPNSFKFGTAPGVASEISNIGNKQSYGAPYLLSSEIGSDLATRGEELSKTFTVLSDLYDLGTGQFDTVKGQDSKTAPVKSLPVNFLVFGSEQGILLEPSNKKKFKAMFSQQLARRCMFSFTRYIEEDVVPDTIEERHKQRADAVKKAGSSFDVLYDSFADLALWLPTNGIISVATDVDDLFSDYEYYNNELSKTISDALPVSKLSRMHKQWLALKLSGVYALLDSEITIEVRHYIDALNTVEYLAGDLEEFEAELDKEPYEVLYDYCLKHADEGKLIIGITDLKKLGFIEGRSGAKARMKELEFLLNDYADDAIFTLTESSLKYEHINRSEVVGVSLLPINGEELQQAIKQGADKAVISKLKQKISHTAVYGYEFVSDQEDGTPLLFEHYAELLKEDYAYTPFKLKDASNAIYDKDKHPNAVGGVRGRDNIEGGTSWVVLDIDDSSITDEETHLILEGINHHIARTSNPNNKFKFRVLIELDMIVTLEPIAWKSFISNIGEQLGLVVDTVPQSQIFYSYKGREVLSVIDGEPLKVKDLVIQANTTAIEKKEANTFTKAEIKTQVANPRNTFFYAFEHPTYTGLSSILLRAARHAFDLTGDREYVINLMHEINNYVDEPLEEERLTNTLLSQISRW
jgi:hypothetical protein